MSFYDVKNIKIYRGPNYYLSQKGIVFDLKIAKAAESLKELTGMIARYLPAAKTWDTDDPISLFIETALEIQKLDMDLYAHLSTHTEIGDNLHEIALEIIDEYTGEDTIYLTEEFLNALIAGTTYDFDGQFQKLQAEFDKTHFGGPTLYSIVHAAYRARVPMFYLPLENQFQWGYGIRQRRGKSTTISTDGIKDTEFTCFKDVVKDFLNAAGFPVPKGGVFTRLDTAMKFAEKLSFPLVVKPVSGHKGQGVTTNIQSKQELSGAFSGLLKSGINDGIIVEQQVSGIDHRILCIGGKCAAVLKRIPAYVDGDGRHTIAELISEENATFFRRNNARSPLARIIVDDDLKAFLTLQNLTLNTIPKEGDRIFLRRVANISAGGVSINVTDETHPDNKKLAENIAAFLNVHALGIDVLADDIMKSWRESPLSIIEINAGPGVFMHLSPARGGSIDVPMIIMESMFPDKLRGRIPILGFNSLPTPLRIELMKQILTAFPERNIGSSSADGIYINGELLSKIQNQWTQVEFLLRHQKLELAMIENTETTIKKDGMRYMGADIVCLISPTSVEAILARDIEPGGWLIISSDSVHKVSPKENVQVCIIEMGDDSTIPSYDVHMRVKPVNGELHISGSEIEDSVMRIPAMQDHIEYGILTCINRILPNIILHYFPGS